MKDLLPAEFRTHKHIEQIAMQTAELYGYEGFATPVLESASVFDRTLGDTSDVVSKEMYSFHDKKNRLVAMRPEFTASVMRAFISNGLKQRLPLKLFSSGPLFRYDRPQEGRQRQFHQLNFEYIGANDPYSDAETISLATHILDNLGILDDLTLELNSLGCTESRVNYQAALKEYFAAHFDALSEDSKKRLETNPLRILDSKDAGDKELSKKAPLIINYYTEEAAEYFEQVKTHLNKLGVKYTLNPKLARGLDYYSHTAFEFTTTKLGAQGTILAGGRYDDLTKLMGESEIPAIGFAAGIERITMMRDFKIEPNRPTIIIPIGDDCTDYAIQTANMLRKSNIKTIIEFSGKIGKRMQTASSLNAQFVIFIGPEEMANNKYKLKDMDAETENEVDQSTLLSTMRHLAIHSV